MYIYRYSSEQAEKDDGTEMIRKLLKENRDQDARNRQYIEFSTVGKEK